MLLSVLVLVAAHSRFVTARMIPTRKTDRLLASWELIQQLGRVPRRLIWDNEPGIGQKGASRRASPAYTNLLTSSDPATKVVRLRPYDPESKGIVERRNGWFETSFMPSRSFTSPADFNTQLAGWLERANSRVVRTIKARPVDLIEHDRSRMMPLPPIPLQLGRRKVDRVCPFLSPRSIGGRFVHPPHKHPLRTALDS